MASKDFNIADHFWCSQYLFIFILFYLFILIFYIN